MSPGTVQSPHLCGGQLKGTAFREFLLWYVDTHPDRVHALRDAIAAMSEEERAGLMLDPPDFGVLSSRWYPSEAIAVILDVVANGLSEDERDVLVRESTRALARSMFRGIYRFVFRQVCTPGLYARHIGKLWGQLHNTGERSVVLRGARQAESTVRNWSGHHPLLCELQVGTMAALFEEMGCEHVTIERVQCVSRGDELCSYVVRWEK